MRKILISTILVSALSLSFIGCGSSSSSSDDETLSETSIPNEYLKIPEIKDQSIRLDGKEYPILEFYSNSNISYRIYGGSSKELFTIEDNKLYFIGEQAGEYTIEINAHDNDTGANGEARELHINVIDKKILDTVAPNFKLPNSMKTGESITLVATNEDDSVTFDITSNTNGFSLNNQTLTAPDTAGTYDITVSATDVAGNISEENTTISVISPVINDDTISFTKVELNPNSDDGRWNWEDANSECQAQGMRLPTIDELEENKDDVYNQAKDIDSDADTSNGVEFASVIWSSTTTDDGQVKGYYFKSSTEATPLDRDKDSKYYFTCVK